MFFNEGKFFNRLLFMLVLFTTNKFILKKNATKRIYEKLIIY